MESSTGARKRLQSDTDGQASVLGMTLVFGLVLVGALAIVAFGASAIGDAKDNLAQQRAEKTLTQLDSEIALVALGETDVHRMPMSGSSGNYYVNESAGWMKITIENTTSGNVKQLFEDYPNDRIQLGKIVYENDGTKIAYQGGGVWKRTRGNGSTMVSPPEFHYRNATLTLPLITVEGSSSLSSGAVIKQTESTTQLFPNATNGWEENPLTEHKVNLTVHSKYYRAWGHFFETRTAAVVDYDHDGNNATITLKVPAGTRTVTGAAAATAGGKLKMSGTGSNGAYTDNYTSADGDGYSSSEADKHGTITNAGDVVVTGDAIVHGNITTGGSISIDGDSNVDGQLIEYVDGNCPSSFSGTCEQISDFQGAAPVDSYVQDNVDRLETSGTDVGIIDDDTTLTSGDYYADKIDLESGETLTLDTSSGAIDLAVKENIKLKGKGGVAEISVTGSNQVKIYLEGNGGSPPTENGGQDQHFWAKKSQITVPGNNSTQLWFYMKKDLNAYIFKDDAGSTSPSTGYTGVIYAPGGSSGTSTVYIKQADWYGAAVASKMELDNKGSIHYDSALADERAVPQDTNIIRITYLHVTQNKVTVSDK